MLVVRALRADKVVPAITDYVGLEMGKRQGLTLVHFSAQPESLPS
jgi:hypothetical protein